MNWYKVFYWFTVADGVKQFFDTFSNVFLGFTIIALIGYVVLAIYRKAGPDLDEKEKTEATYWVTSFRKITVWCTILCVITWAGWVFTPSRKDAIVIIAGGAVGNFITSDSSAKQIPSELTMLIREKMRSEVEELKKGIIEKPLEERSKEELIELLKKK